MPATGPFFGLMIICLTVALMVIGSVVFTYIGHYHKNKRKEANRRHKERMKRIDNQHEKAMFMTTIDNAETINELQENDMTIENPEVLPATVDE